MTSLAAPSNGLTTLDFHGPMSGPRADRFVERLAGPGVSSIVDLGCGWGELLLRMVSASPGATGTGVDVRPADLARGRRHVLARGLGDRVELIEESATATTRGPADLVLCVGSSHALSDAPPPDHTASALRRLRRSVASGGRVLFGESYWSAVPRPEQLAAMWPGARIEEHHDLDTLVTVAVVEGFRPVGVETASDDEWEQFESGYQADLEMWLAAHDGHAAARSIREQVDAHRRAWLTGYRGVLGMAYLTPAPVE